MAPFPSTIPRLPAFTDEGVLPPGDYAPSRAKFERSFVNVGNAVRRADEKVTVAGLRYWMKWFGRTRVGMEKGRVWASVGGFDEHA